MRYPFIELAGSDRSGKGTLHDAISKYYDKDSFSYNVIVERALYDYCALDIYFDRAKHDAIKQRLSLLENAKYQYLVIWLYAPDNVIEFRQSAQVHSGYLDGSVYNRKVIDAKRMNKVYQDLYDKTKMSISILKYDTSLFTAEDIVKDLIKLKILEDI